MGYKQELSTEVIQSVVKWDDVFDWLGITYKYEQALSARIAEHTLVGAVTVGISEKLEQYQAAKDSQSPLTVAKTELPTESEMVSCLYSLVRLDLGDGIVALGSMIPVGYRNHMNVNRHEVHVTESAKGNFTADDVSLVARAEAHLAEVGCRIIVEPSEY